MIGTLTMPIIASHRANGIGSILEIVYLAIKMNFYTARLKRVLSHALQNQWNSAGIKKGKSLNLRMKKAIIALLLLLAFSSFSAATVSDYYPIVQVIPAVGYSHKMGGTDRVVLWDSSGKYYV